MCVFFIITLRFECGTWWCDIYLQNFREGGNLSRATNQDLFGVAFDIILGLNSFNLPFVYLIYHLYLHVHMIFTGNSVHKNLIFVLLFFAIASGGGISGGVRGPFTRLRGPFTPSQWMELEHQALIYKHIMANVPVPSNLLIPLKRSLYSYGSPGSYASNLCKFLSLNWLWSQFL